MNTSPPAASPWAIPSAPIWIKLYRLVVLFERMLSMKRLILNTVAAALIAGAGAVIFRAQPAFAQVPAAGSADVVLTNGKIITVDNQFRIAQAIAIKGDRFI